MGRVYLLDCTLRDGGYINDWRFGQDAIRGFCQKIARTGIEMFEVGFLKGDGYDPDRSVFPDIASFREVIVPKDPSLCYVGMLDMKAPVPLDRIEPYDGTSIDGIRVIFKKDRIEEALVYCRVLKDKGYRVFANFVGTDAYTDREFIEGIERFNVVAPHVMTIVDSFGVIKRKQFLRLVYLADHNMAPGIMLGYHAHNNLQQAMGNAEALVELNLQRGVCIDACVFGMGRGAGNLDLELFADFMNENYGTHYRIDPMLEIMDEYLSEIYRTRFWGYSLPLYLSAVNGCHPNYAIYLAQKDALTVKGFSELLRSIPPADKVQFDQESAERSYRRYQEEHCDDRAVIEELSHIFAGKRLLLLAPGKSLEVYADRIHKVIETETDYVIAVNFLAEAFRPDFIFSANMRRYARIQGKTEAKCIITSNLQKEARGDYVVDFIHFASKQPEIMDNSALMLLRLLETCGVRTIQIAGMDGYSAHHDGDYYDPVLEYDFSREAERRNAAISAELRALKMRLDLLTPTEYRL